MFTQMGLKPAIGLGIVLVAFIIAALINRIADLGKLGSWPEILADLDSLTETEVEQDNKRLMRRSAPRPADRNDSV